MKNQKKKDSLPLRVLQQELGPPSWLKDIDKKRQVPKSRGIMEVYHDLLAEKEAATTVEKTSKPRTPKISPLDLVAQLLRQD